MPPIDAERWAEAADLTRRLVELVDGLGGTVAIAYSVGPKRELGAIPDGVAFAGESFPIRCLTDAVTTTDRELREAFPDVDDVPGRARRSFVHP